MILPRIKLRYSLMLLFTGIMAVSFVLAMSQAIIKFQDIERKNALSQEQRLAQNTAKEITEFIGLQFAKLETIGSTHPLLSINPDFQGDFLEQMLFSNEAFEELSLVDEKGMETARVSRTRVITSKDLTDQSYSEKFLQVKDRGRFISGVFWDRNRQFFTAGQAIFAPHGGLRGAIFADVSAGAIQRAIGELTARTQERVYLVDGEGIVIAHPDISQVLRRKDFTSLPIVRSLIAPDAPTDFITDIYQNELNQEVIGTGSAILLSFGENETAKTLQTDWFIIAEIPTFAALASVREITTFSIFVLFAVLILAAAAAMLFAQRLAKPIEILHQGAQEIGAGNLDYAFDIKTNDELQDLAEEFRRMSKRLKETRAREETLSKLKSEFVSIAAHQLRTPLSAIKWTLRMILDGDLGEVAGEQKEFLERTYQSNERMIRLINDLLNIARIEEGRYIYRKSLDNLAIITEFVVGLFKDVTQKKEITLELLKAREKLPLIPIDVDKIKLAIQNLIDNAVQYTPPGGKITISLKYDEKNEEVVFSIRDTGIGISEEEKTRIFSKFFRGASAIKMDTDGSGLGLFLVKNIVEAHSGRIWFESKEKRGTTFYFAIPVKSVL